MLWSLCQHPSTLTSKERQDIQQENATVYAKNYFA